MEIIPLRADLKKILGKYSLTRKFNKQKRLFEDNPRHPSLHTEKLLPRSLGIYSFRLDQKWRVIFIILPNGKAEIIDINPHYR